MLIIYLRPVYTIVFLTLFYAEYWFFIRFFITLRSHPNDYYRLEIKEIDLSDMGFFDLWIEYCKIQAFQRIYFLYSSKKLKFRNIFYTFIIVMLNIPFKFLKLSYLLLKSNKNFRTTLELLYIQSFYLIKNYKIEVLNGKIYLNCCTIGKFCAEVLKLNPNLTKENFKAGIDALQTQMRDFLEYETKPDMHIKINLAQATDHNNKVLFTTHYTYFERSSILKSVHMTSNVPQHITNKNIIIPNKDIIIPDIATQSMIAKNTILKQQYTKSQIKEQNIEEYLKEHSKETLQCRDAGWPSLTKINARNPGTVFSYNVGNIKTYENKYKIIPAIEVAATKYNHPGQFELEKDMKNHIVNKDVAFKDIFKTHLNIDKISPDLLKDLRANNYTLLFLETKDQSLFIEEFDRCLKNLEQCE